MPFSTSKLFYMTIIFLFKTNKMNNVYKQKKKQKFSVLFS